MSMCARVCVGVNVCVHVSWRMCPWEILEIVKMMTDSAAYLHLIQPILVRNLRSGFRWRRILNNTVFMHRK